MQVIVDSLLTTYQRLGTGKTLVVLHGWGDNSQSWLTLGAAMAKKYDVVIPDLPGFGGTQAPSDAWGLDEYARFVAHFLKKLEVDNVYAYIGHSNGGAITMRGLSTDNLTCDKLILLASAGIRGQYKGRVKALRYVTKIGKTLSSPLPQNTKKKLRQKVYATVGSDMLVAEHLQATFKRVVTDDVQADAANISVPTLLIYGEADQQAPTTYGEKFHELIDNSTLEILPGAGHFLQIDRQADVKHAVEEFLK
ncbi:MAG TPA: alpha/beta hydrolase [Candidatus Saccharimonadales bacterium]|nr:alpha/beta hydrolase [Candidatus Saccharimonadales bacterium]